MTQEKQEAERKGQWIAHQQILQLQKEEEKFKTLERKLHEKVREEHEKVLVLQKENEVGRNEKKKVCANKKTKKMFLWFIKGGKL